VHRAAKQFGFKEVGEEEDWNLYWTDFSVSLERVMEMKRYQVRTVEVLTIIAVLSMIRRLLVGLLYTITC